MRIKLRDPIKKTKTVEVEARPALYADKCDSCGLVFCMREFCNEQGRAELRGTFDLCPDDEDGKGMGNGFRATVCSFLCAHHIFAEERWKKMKDYAPYVMAGARLARAEVVLTAAVATETQIVSAWEQAPEGDAVRGVYGGVLLATRIQ